MKFVVQNIKIPMILNTIYNILKHTPYITINIRDVDYLDYNINYKKCILPWKGSKYISDGVYMLINPKFENGVDGINIIYDNVVVLKIPLNTTMEFNNFIDIQDNVDPTIYMTIDGYDVIIRFNVNYVTRPEEVCRLVACHTNILNTFYKNIDLGVIYGYSKQLKKDPSEILYLTLDSRHTLKTGIKHKLKEILKLSNTSDECTILWDFPFIGKTAIEYTYSIIKFNQGLFNNIPLILDGKYSIRTKIDKDVLEFSEHVPMLNFITETISYSISVVGIL